MTSYADPSGGPKGDEPPGPTMLALALEAAGVAGLAMCITLMFLGMRSVMAVGGSCADGGPYVSAQHCPDGAGAAVTLGMLGLFAFGAITLGVGGRIGGIWAASPLLAWAGLFLSLGWNFLDGGLFHADPQSGPDAGAVLCGVVFVVMGASPLVAMAAMGVARVNHAWGLDAPPSMGRSSSWLAKRRKGSSDAASVWSVSRDSTPFRALSSLESALQTPAPEQVARPPVDDDAVAHIERLGELHARGELTDAEYHAALAAAIHAGRGDKA